MQQLVHRDGILELGLVQSLKHWNVIAAIVPSVRIHDEARTSENVAFVFEAPDHSQLFHVTFTIKFKAVA